MMMLLVLLHTGTMFAMIVYFWRGWRRDYLASSGQIQWFAILVIIATACTGVVGVGLQKLIETVVLRGHANAEIEDIFSNLPLMAGALAAVGVLIIIAGLREEKTPRHADIQPVHSVWIGLVQGLCLPFRGFSRSGATISTGLLCGLPKVKLEEFSFALAVVLTPAVIYREAHRLLKVHALSGSGSVLHLFAPGLIGMVLSFIAGLLALKWLSQWLEGGRWKFFGFYCLAAAAGVLAVNFLVK
jgi:undecaprenyl-diphosphatase